MTGAAMKHMIESVVIAIDLFVIAVCLAGLVAVAVAYIRGGS
jgi:hypothetical protein